jgi:hypothetical protein
MKEQTLEVGELVWHPEERVGEKDSIVQIVNKSNTEGYLVYEYKHVFQKFELSFLAKTAHISFRDSLLGKNYIKINNDEVRRKVIDFVLGE